MQCEEGGYVECGITSPASRNAHKAHENEGNVCVVCMDRERDIMLKPCGHNSCCAICFMRLSSRQCPVCRAPSSAACFLGTGHILPRLRFCETRASAAEGSGGEVGDALNPYVYIRRMPVASDRRYSEPRSKLGTEPVATQAASSTRSIRTVRYRDVTRERIWRSMHSTSGDDLCAEKALSSLLSTDCRHSLSTSANPCNVVLLGQSRTLMMSLVNRLRTIFPPPTWEDPKIYRKMRSLLYVQNEAMRLVLLEGESNTTDTRSFIECIRQYSPRMILLCANFFNLSSFESAVRLDLEVLHFVHVPCLWVLIKTGAKENKLSNRVENSDVSAAKHFVTSPRRCFIATVDSVFPSDIRKLGLEIRLSAWRDNDTPFQHHRSSSMRNLNLKRAIFRNQQR